MLSVTCAGRRVTSRGIVDIRATTKGMEKERKARKARKAKEKAQNPRMVTPSRKVLAITVVRSVTLHANVRRKRKQPMQVPVVEVAYIA